MTEKDIISKIALWLDDRKYPFQLPNAFIYAWECDYWAMDAVGITREFEIKISRQDFLNDAKKEKHSKGNGANYFYYVCPSGLIRSNEIDPRYGLLYIHESGLLEIVKKPRQLHSQLFADWKMLANKMYWRFRQLWRDKYIAKEISVEEYKAGFNLTLEETEKL